MIANKFQQIIISCNDEKFLLPYANISIMRRVRWYDKETASEWNKDVKENANTFAEIDIMRRLRQYDKERVRDFDKDVKEDADIFLDGEKPNYKRRICML